MKLSHLTGDELDRSGLEAKRAETSATSVVLHHLREVERRRHFATAHKLNSLFAYAVTFMGYSEDQANRRIAAMRLLKELPMLEKKIESGELTLTHLNKAQQMFRREKQSNRSRSIESKLSVLKKIEKLPMLALEKVLDQETFAPQPKKKTEAITLEQFSEPVQRKLKRLLEVRSHAIKGHDLEKLIDQMAELALNKWDQVERAKRAEQKEARSRIAADAKHRLPKAADLSPDVANDAAVPALAQVNYPKRMYVDARTRHALFTRDESKCQKCGATHLIQIDHIVPVAMGGSNDLENLRLLCRSCNLGHAFETYGVSKMNNYLGECAKSYGIADFNERSRRRLRPLLFA